MEAPVLIVCIGVPNSTSTVGTLVECGRLAPLALGVRELLDDHWSRVTP